MLIKLLREAAAAHPDAPLIVSGGGTVTRGQCLEASLELAEGLRACSIGRFACVLGAVDLVPLLCASTVVGAEACTYPAGADAETVARLMATFDHDVLITDSVMQPAGRAPVTPAALRTAAAGAKGSPPSPERFPAMVLSSGTTGDVKGARHDWGRLVAGVPRAPQPDARWLLTYNLNQFAGVQMLLHVLVNGATLVVPESNQPREALDAIRTYRITHVSATPTFWRFVVAMLDERSAAELSLVQITLGGEAVPAPLIGQLRGLFPHARVSQVYGSTEGGISISVRDARNGLPVSVLDRGDDAPTQMKVVDGQLFIRSKVGMLGYYGEPEIGEGEWRPTGDLVEVRGDRIFFVGRASEIINVGGVKVHPLPVEEAVSAVPGVALVRAYGRANPLTGQIVAVDVVATPGADAEALEDAIRAACAGLPAAAQPRRIRFVDHIDIRGQKIIRRQPEEQ